MYQPAARSTKPTNQARKRPPGRNRRTAVIAAVAVLFVIIVIAAAIDGLRMRMVYQRQALETSVPLREQVYPGPVSTSPTVVTAVQQADKEATPSTSAPAPQSAEEGALLPLRNEETVHFLRSGPGTQYAMVKALTPGEEVQPLIPPIEINGQQWQWVRTYDGQAGWCMTSWLSPVNPGE